MKKKMDIVEIEEEKFMERCPIHDIPLIWTVIEIPIDKEYNLRKPIGLCSKCEQMKNTLNNEGG